MNVILISAKMQNGKDTFAELLKEELEVCNKKVLIAHYADLLKYICKTFFGWDGNKDGKGRSLLQYVGTDKIRNYDDSYWVNFIIEFLKMFYDEWDYVIIPDTRFPNEVERMKEVFKNNTYTIRVTRPNFDSGATQEQLNHASETSLDDYDFETHISNCGSLDALRFKARHYIGYVLKVKEITYEESI